jgi:hypothetical protein
MHNMGSLLFSPRELVATDGCIVFEKHIHLRCVSNEALPPMFQYHVPSHEWRPLSVQRADYRPHMGQTGLAFHRLHCSVWHTLSDYELPASFQPLLPISANKNASQEVSSLHGSFQCRSHPTSSRVLSPNHPHLILGSLKYSLPKKGYLFFRDNLKSRGLT